MGWSIENGAALQELPDKSQISGKKAENIVGNWEKAMSKSKIFFRNYSNRLARILSAIRAGRARAVEEIIYTYKWPLTNRN